jgi:hypothetical protein
MRAGRAHLSAVALVILAILFGHDVLMAADPHDAGSSHEAHATGEAPDGTACHAPEGVRPDPPDQPAPALPGDVLGVIPAHIPVDAGRLAWTEPPTHPPDVLRALLQVFLN